MEKTKIEIKLKELYDKAQKNQHNNYYVRELNIIGIAYSDETCIYSVGDNDTNTIYLVSVRYDELEKEPYVIYWYKETN